MTTLVLFQPSPLAPFSFIATLDGQQYSVSVAWNLFGQRWYVTVSTLAGAVVLSEGLNGSPAAVSFESLDWDNGYVTGVTANPHGYVVGATAALVVGGCAPDAYNGDVAALVVDDETLTWPLAVDPGPATARGTVVFDIDLVEQYFETSTVVFRESTQQFEINP